MGSYRKNLMLSLGLVSAQVDLHAVAESKRSTLHRYCPDHNTRLKQQYICTADGQVVTDFIKGAEGPTTIRIVTDDDKPEFPKDEKFELIPVPVKDIEAHTFHEGGFYYCQPSSAATADAWVLFRSILAKNKVGFVAFGSVRAGERKMWRLQLFNDYLVLSELRYPEAARPVPGVSWGSASVDMPKPSREHMKLMTQLVDQATTEWDKIDTVDPNKALLDQWLAGAYEVPRTDTVEPESPAVSMMDALKGSIEATRKSA